LLSIPTHDELIEAIGQRFTFSLAGGPAVAAVLTHAPAGIPMNDRFVCCRSPRRALKDDKR
jgi:hypothetical protein